MECIIYGFLSKLVKTYAEKNTKIAFVDLLKMLVPTCHADHTWTYIWSWPCIKKPGPTCNKILLWRKMILITFYQASTHGT